MVEKPKKKGGRRLTTDRARTAALTRRRELLALAAIASRQGTGLWIVGGAARDLLLRRDVREVDVAVAGDAGRIAEKMEKAGFGRAVALSRLAPRVFRIAGKREIDLAELGGVSIEEDLRRRDFTINSIAFDLLRREWIDPFGGRDDLLAGRLRLVAPRNLEEDPLRVVRAARFMATLGLRPDAATSRASIRAAPGLQAVAPERIRAEWVKLFEAPRAATAVAWADRAGALHRSFHLTEREARRIRRASALFDAAAVRRQPAESRRRLRLALLGALAGIDSERAARWLASLRYGRTESYEVAALVGLASRGRKAVSVAEQWTWVRDAGALAPQSLILLEVLSPREPAARRLRRRLARARRRGPRVCGADVLEWTGLTPGPEIGRLLARLEIEVLSGTVRTRPQARAWLREEAGRGARI